MDLDDPIGKLAFVGPVYIKRLAKLDIRTVSDLLHHIPHRYIDFRKTTSISSLKVGDMVTIRGEILEAKNQYTRSARKIQMIRVRDRSGSIEAIWFNQPYLTNSLKTGMEVSLAGKVDWWGSHPALISPEYEAGGSKIHTGRLVPVYRETSGISSKWLRRRITETFTATPIREWLPQEIIQENKLLDLYSALKAVHFPQNFEEVESGRRRLAFDELLKLHLSVLHRKKGWQKNKVAHRFKIDPVSMYRYIDTLPFRLTDAQQNAVKELLSDLKRDTPMNRLLEGDVGSGKTVVAAIGIYASFLNGYQSVVMAPTQILAAQHFATLSKFFEPFKIRLSLLTASTRLKDPGRTDVFVGTHSLIHKKAGFENVGLVVIDEQHKFGVEQRTHLIQKSKSGTKVPHVLTMTATPIPRSVAQTIYGDLDLSILDEMPGGRQKVTTWLIPPEKREKAYKWIEDQLIDNKTQAYIVCPLIEESETETLKDVRAVNKEFIRLKKIFRNLNLGLMHGRLADREKKTVIDKFKSGQTDILLTTPVVEVGIDIPNATIILIEGAERFGLATLHQLRGRVGRGDKKSYCLIMAEERSEKSAARLNALIRSHSGFELAEIDLKMRGPGEIFGTKQSGFPELKTASWQDTSLITQTRKIAEHLIELGHDTSSKKETY